MSEQDVSTLVGKLLLAEASSKSNWESEFLDSVSEQLEKGRSLSDKQVKIVEEIHEKLYPDDV